VSLRAIYGPPSFRRHRPDQVQVSRYFEWVPGTATIKRRVRQPAANVIVIVTRNPQTIFDSVFGVAA
jgi:hypothetical protein